MKKILLFPFNGNAREAAAVIEDINKHGQQWELAGFIDDDRSKTGKNFGRYPVLGGREKINEIPDALVLAVPGRPENFQDRSRVIASLALPDKRYATIIHPTAVIGLGCAIGPNTLIMPHVVLTASVTLGKNVVILPNTVLSHDVSIGDDTMIGSNVSISGSVRVGCNCYLGTGTKIIQEIEIGKQSMIGLGSVVLADVPPNSVVAGNPARPVR